MFCHRCRGLLVRETFCELRDKPGGLGTATRCINCGYLEDSVVRANRRHPPAAKQSVPHKMVKKGELAFLSPHSEEY